METQQTPIFTLERSPSPCSYAGTIRMSGVWPGEWTPGPCRTKASEPWAQGPGRGRCWGKSVCSGRRWSTLLSAVLGSGEGRGPSPALQRSSVLMPALQVEGSGVWDVAQGCEPVYPTPPQGQERGGLPHSWSQTWGDPLLAELHLLQTQGSLALASLAPSTHPVPASSPVLLPHTALLLRSRGGLFPGRKHALPYLRGQQVQVQVQCTRLPGRLVWSPVEATLK